MERGSETQGNHRFASEQIGRERMKIEGLPEGFEIVRIGSPNKGEDFVIHAGEVMTSVVDFISDCYVIVRRIEEPSPGDGWRWVKPGEKLSIDDFYLDSFGEYQPTWRCGSVVHSKHTYCRRIGPRLRKVGERLQRGDYFIDALGHVKRVPGSMCGMEVVGGRYYAEQ